MPLYIYWVMTALSWLYMRVFDRKRWEAFKDREGGMGALPPFSRRDTAIYGMFGLSILYMVTDSIFRGTAVVEQTERNTKAMGEVIEKMSASSDQSRDLLAAMREEADAARRETAAAQKLALWVGVGTAIVGAILGGVAGAFAAEGLN